MDVFLLTVLHPDFSEWDLRFGCIEFWTSALLCPVRARDRPPQQSLNALRFCSSTDDVSEFFSRFPLRRIGAMHHCAGSMVSELFIMEAGLR